MDRDRVKSVIDAMLAMQRYPWEQGVCAHALYEAGLDELWIPMAYDTIKRQNHDGRLAMIGGEVTVSDPAANGEVCLRAYEKTGDEIFLNGAKGMLRFLIESAPRTSEGIICHNNISFTEGYSADQVWVDGLYMVPPFLAVMGYLDEATEQVKGYRKYLYDEDEHIFYHIYDAGQKRFLRKVHWATGNGWALMGLARIIEEAMISGRSDLADDFADLFRNTLKGMLKYILPDGRFRDILDDPDSFVDGTSAMMMAAAIFRGYRGGFLDFGLEYAEKALETVSGKIDKYGLIREVSGCPDFVSEGTSAEAQAAFVMAYAQRELL
ncbi:MAG: glycoside hydrolase family 88 protein [Lachnospiraceae bacterium]|nr:glycoside hydrolase family 88 protein [Lachnospiraceae bacterium]